jgi:hypothetical protein
MSKSIHLLFTFINIFDTIVKCTNSINVVLATELRLLRKALGYGKINVYRYRC